MLNTEIAAESGISQAISKVMDMQTVYINQQTFVGITFVSLNTTSVVCLEIRC